MIRLQIVAEGQTELGFHDAVLRPHFALLGVFTYARCVQTSRKGHRIFRGGLRSYAQLRGDLLRWMKEDQNPEAHFTTMIDLYRLPKDFPGYDEANQNRSAYDRVKQLEHAFGSDISHPRFIPYIQLHEFEALLLCDPAKFDHLFVGQSEAIRGLVQMVSQFSSPEMIDDGTETAPSKRIVREIPEYENNKALAGRVIAEKIGIQMMRQKCQHFHEWLSRIESLPLLTKG